MEDRGGHLDPVEMVAIERLRDLDARIAFLDDLIAGIPVPDRRPVDRDAVSERRELTHRRDELRDERERLVDRTFPLW
jgi:hypothetical protein